MSDVTENNETPLNLCQDAHNQIAQIIDGNGAQSSDLTSNCLNTHIYELIGYLILDLYPDVQTTKSTGQNVQGTQCSSINDMNDKIKEKCAALTKDDALKESIIEAIKKYPNFGWGLNGEDIVVPEQNESFFHKEICAPCQGKGQTVCQRCSAKGQILCSQCQGKGQIICIQCKGLRDIVMPDGRQVPCIKCQQMGMDFCPMCRGTKMFACPVCNGAKFEVCKQCQKAGWQNVSSTVTIKAKTQFNTQFNGEISAETIEALKTIDLNALAAQGYIQVTDMQSALNEQGQIVIVYKAQLPMANAEFTIKEKKYAVHLLGYKAHIFNMGDFLDEFIKPGITSLSKIAKKPTAISSLIKEASQYRIVSFVISQISSTSKKQILNKLTQDYPIGLSEKYAKTLIVHSEKALDSIITKPKQKGLSTGLIISITIACSWFLSPARDLVIAKELPVPPIGLDLGLFLVCSFLTVFIAKNMSTKALAAILPQSAKKPLKMGTLDFIACIVIAVIFAALSQI